MEPSPSPADANSPRSGTTDPSAQTSKRTYMKVPYDFANLPQSEKDKFVKAFVDQILGPDPSGPDGDQ